MSEHKHAWDMEMGTDAIGTCVDCGKRKLFLPVDNESYQWKGRPKSTLSNEDLRASRQAIHETQKDINITELSMTSYQG